ncbi:MAG TPA: ribbon-helix-helix domain-containing protein [Micromonosporaceae bacterium]
MKLSVSLPEDDVAFVDEYSEKTGMTSRSSVIHKAIGLLRETSLQDAYAMAFEEWETVGESRLWDEAVGDGIVDATR